MTRDEAAKKCFEATKGDELRNGYSLVDVLAALGVLKLDEPMSKSQKAWDNRHAQSPIHVGSKQLRIQKQINFKGIPIDASEVIWLLHNAGLRLVEAE
jgi:hypothetical protein